MGTALYHEARGESVRVQRAVMDVILHRAKVSGHSVCQVVSKPHQFAWYKKHGIKPLNKTTERLLIKAKSIPEILRNEKFFYSGPQPVWARGMMCHPIGHMTFCKEKR